MAARNFIVRKMDALESLGAVANICSDKAGTLIRGKMVAKKCWIPRKGTYSVGRADQSHTRGSDVCANTNPHRPQRAETYTNEETKTATALLANNILCTEFLYVGSATRFMLATGWGWPVLPLRLSLVLS